MGKLETDIENIVRRELKALNRPDLYREPLVAYSSAEDARYLQLKTIIGEWHMAPREVLADAQSVISYFVPFTEEVALSPKKSKAETFMWGEAYAVINDYFIHINEVICEHLTQRGYSASAIPSTHTYNPEDMKCMWSHRSAAVIAGLGSFGANRMLITEKGSGGRLCTVLTSAVLSDERKLPDKQCLYLKNGSCGLCFQACPVGALKSDTIDRFACQKVTDRNGRVLEETVNLQEADTCGKCVGVCPLAYIE